VGGFEKLKPSFIKPRRTLRFTQSVMSENELTGKIIGCAIKVHNTLGPGLLESAYKECLNYELIKSGLIVEKEKQLPLVYEEVKLECGYRADLFVEKSVIVEIKSVDALNDIHLAQTLTYLKLAKRRIGLLINFNVLQLKSGIKRVINGY
jgi:GxxExxY protein